LLLTLTSTAASQQHSDDTPGNDAWLGGDMGEALIVLKSALSADERAAITRAAPVKQAISDRVFVAEVADQGLDDFRARAGVARVVTGGEPIETLPEMTDAERLFVRAWLSSRGEVKSRRGEGLDWDTPPMVPPDPKR
jgi:hypothetical protein